MAPDTRVCVELASVASATITTAVTLTLPDVTVSVTSLAATVLGEVVVEIQEASFVRKLAWSNPSTVPARSKTIWTTGL